MEQVDWIGLLGGKPPAQPSVIKVWRELLVKTWDGMTREERAEVHIWFGNQKRRSATGEPPARELHTPWFDAWPGWVDRFGPRPYEDEEMRALWDVWYARYPEELRKAINRPERTRRPIPLGIRLKVLERSGFRCSYCGRPAREVQLHVDHIQPFSKGGADDISNYAAACPDCNIGKGARILEATPV